MGMATKTSTRRWVLHVPDNNLVWAVRSLAAIYGVTMGEVIDEAVAHLEDGRKRDTWQPPAEWPGQRPIE